MTDNARPLPEFALTPEMKHGRRVFDATMRSAQDLITRGVPPAAIISGLLGVVSELGAATCGRREVRRLLMLVADSNAEDDQLDA